MKVLKVEIRYDAEGDFLEVLFSDAPGQMRSRTTTRSWNGSTPKGTSSVSP